MAILSRLRTAVLAAAFGLLSMPAFAQSATPNWVVAWSTSHSSLLDTKVSNATVRMVARVTIPGETVRVRLSNVFGTAPVTFDNGSIGAQVRGAQLAAELVRPLRFGGKNSVTIPAGGTVESDAVALHVEAQQDIAVSLFVSGTDVQPSVHNNAFVTSYLTENGAGDQTASADGKSFTVKTAATYWLKAIDVQPATKATAIVALGDSITDGTCSSPEARDRWEDVLAERLALQNPARIAVVNEGIGGNTLFSYTPPAFSTPAPDRLERDVLAHPGVGYVVLFLGTNDIRRGASTARVVEGLKAIMARVKAKGIKVVGATIVPRHSVVPGIADTAWDEGKTKIRNEVNAWIRGGAGFDAVLDFDKVLRRPDNPDLLQNAYECGDGIHPSPLGYFQMGKAIDLRLFRVR